MSSPGVEARRGHGQQQHVVCGAHHPTQGIDVVLSSLSNRHIERIVIFIEHDEPTLRDHTYGLVRQIVDSPESNLHKTVKCVERYYMHTDSSVTDWFTDSGSSPTDSKELDSTVFILGVGITSNTLNFASSVARPFVHCAIAELRRLHHQFFVLLHETGVQQGDQSLLDKCDDPGYGLVLYDLWNASNGSEAELPQPTWVTDKVVPPSLISLPDRMWRRFKIGAAVLVTLAIAGMVTIAGVGRQ
jgi:hypothetical protein